MVFGIPCFSPAAAELCSAGLLPGAGELPPSPGKVFARVLVGQALLDLGNVFQGGLEPPAKLPVWIAGVGWEAGGLKSAGAFPLIQPRRESAPGFWEGLSKPLCPAAGTGIIAGRCK